MNLPSFVLEEPPLASPRDLFYNPYYELTVSQASKLIGVTQRQFYYYLNEEKEPGEAVKQLTAIRIKQLRECAIKKKVA